MELEQLNLHRLQNILLLINLPQHKKEFAE